MMSGWVIWLGLFIGYFVLDGVGTKNIIATNKLDRYPAAISSAFMYILGIAGSVICIKHSIWDIIPIAVGAFAGTFYMITWERIKHNKINANNKRYSRTRLHV